MYDVQVFVDVENWGTLDVSDLVLRRVMVSRFYSAMKRAIEEEAQPYGVKCSVEVVYKSTYYPEG